MVFIMLINVKTPTIVGILTFISKINTTPESLKARKVFNFPHFKFLREAVEICSVGLSMKKSFIVSGPNRECNSYNSPHHGSTSQL